MGCACNSDRAPKKYAFLVRMPRGRRREIWKVSFRLMKQVCIWTKVDTVEYRVRWRVGGISGVLPTGCERDAGRLMIRGHRCPYSQVKIASFCISWSHMVGGGIAPFILHLGIRWKCVVTFMSRLLDAKKETLSSWRWIGLRPSWRVARLPPSLVTATTALSSYV